MWRRRRAAARRVRRPTTTQPLSFPLSTCHALSPARACYALAQGVPAQAASESRLFASRLRKRSPQSHRHSCFPAMFALQEHAALYARPADLASAADPRGSAGAALRPDPPSPPRPPLASSCQRLSRGASFADPHTLQIGEPDGERACPSGFAGLGLLPARPTASQAPSRSATPKRRHARRPLFRAAVLRSCSLPLCLPP